MIDNLSPAGYLMLRRIEVMEKRLESIDTLYEKIEGKDKVYILDVREAELPGLTMDGFNTPIPGNVGNM